MIRAIDQWGRMIEQLIWFRTLRASASNTMEEKPAFEAACKHEEQIMSIHWRMEEKPAFEAACNMRSRL